VYFFFPFVSLDFYTYSFTEDFVKENRVKIKTKKKGEDEKKA